MSNLSTVAYLVSSVLFIMSLRGLSHPTTARRGNFYGIIGMTIAIVTTVANPGVLSYKEIGIAFVIGGLIGSIIATRIQMTSLPQLVAAFHSLVGLAAVFVAAYAFYKTLSEAQGLKENYKWAWIKRPQVDPRKKDRTATFQIQSESKYIN